MKSHLPATAFGIILTAAALGFGATAAHAPDHATTTGYSSIQADGTVTPR